METEAQGLRACGMWQTANLTECQYHLNLLELVFFLLATDAFVAFLKTANYIVTSYVRRMCFKG